jgi:two-component system chemotaxis response regulator CheY
MSAKILVVDDSASIRLLLTGILREAGFQVQTAMDGVEGFTGACQFQPHLIIADLNMPNENGLELTRNLRRKEAFRFTPILILTTEALPELKEEGRKAGATGWIVKPIGAEQLCSIVRKFV